MNAPLRSPHTTSSSRYTRARTAGDSIARAAPFAAPTPSPSATLHIAPSSTFASSATVSLPPSPPSQMSHFSTAVCSRPIVLRRRTHMGGPRSHQRQAHAGAGMCAPYILQPESPSQLRAVPRPQVATPGELLRDCSLAANVSLGCNQSVWRALATLLLDSDEECLQEITGQGGWNIFRPWLPCLLR